MAGQGEATFNPFTSVKNKYPSYRPRSDRRSSLRAKRVLVTDTAPTKSHRAVQPSTSSSHIAMVMMQTITCTVLKVSAQRWVHHEGTHCCCPC